ncbi:hypothetical protein KSP35_12970 [Aquihabitans sp. G128]|uniref:hypothetical protein n=1 Tax=Aquihabitans sp. G128 TaxID=2849779 RepID=UPI001C250F77|nr:hypothetical protein [Aquihabitans sp. G128]QXC59314.1 hypothetical protein KSP35_12970 [Aquihabitans sp. G128]
MNAERRRWWHRRPHLYPRPAWRLRAWFRFRALVRSERAWRLVGMLAFASSSLLSAYTLIRTEGERCSIRVESRQSIRRAINAAVDQGAIELGADGSQRVAIGQHVSERVYKELPPPTC